MNEEVWVVFGYDGYDFAAVYAVFKHEADALKRRDNLNDTELGVSTYYVKKYEVLETEED